MVEFEGHSVAKVAIARSQYDVLLGHCLRKLRAEYHEGETSERKAYGLVGGSLEQDVLTVRRIAPLKKNVRALAPYKSHMDDILGRFAIPSETPLDKRAWVADPGETRRILREFTRAGMDLVGTYHMHRVGWENDPLRDTPTELDTVLAEDSEAFLFVVSMVHPEKPIVRTFYEGIPDQEVRIVLA